MSDYEVREHEYELPEDNDSEVLQESDVDGFRQTTPVHEENHNRLSAYSSHSAVVEPEEIIVTEKIPQLDDYEEKNEEQHPETDSVLSSYSSRLETAVTRLETATNNIENAPSRDENENVARHTAAADDEDMGSAKRAAQAYQAAVQGVTAAERKSAEEDHERAELNKKKKVSDLISRFNSGDAFKANAATTGTYKNDYGVGKIGSVSTGQFK